VIASSSRQNFLDAAMTEKITCFEELLSLDPLSTLFFPLAQAYVQEERLGDAVNVLRRGLAVHPKHLEARLLLIQCLADQRQDAVMKPEVENIVASLSACSAFWDAWARQSKEKGRHDLALTLQLLTLLLDGRFVSWGDILEQGLRNLSSENTGPSSEQHDVSRRSAVFFLEDNPAPETTLDLGNENVSGIKAQTETDRRGAVPEAEQGTSDPVNDGDRAHILQKSTGQGDHGASNPFESSSLEPRTMEPSNRVPDDHCRDLWQQELQTRTGDLLESWSNRPVGVDVLSFDQKQNPPKDTLKTFLATDPAPKPSGPGEFSRETKPLTSAHTLLRLAERLEHRAWG
jgi:hypothetical protein